MYKPLEGVRVLDLTNVLAGPLCCHQLAHMGADVIKVEARRRGDLARQLGADQALNRANMGTSFLAHNPGKRSITVNLKHPMGKAVLRRLVRTADVLVENFRPGVLQRLGVGYEALLEDNPKLIYCAISGFGQDGPLRDLPAYDQIIQGMCGMMSLTGQAGAGPSRVGYSVADAIGGITAGFAIASALADPNRGDGCLIDVSMLEAVIATMGWPVSNYLVAGSEPTPTGNDSVTASPSGTFCTGSGPLNICANTQEQFETLCRVVGRAALIDDARFSERWLRLQHRTELKALLEEALSARPAEEWWNLLTEAGVPAGPVYTVPEALSHPQIKGRRMVATFKGAPGVGRDIRVVRTGIKFNGQAPSVSTPPPTLGQHTAALLAELGYSDREIDVLQSEKAI